MKSAYHGYNEIHNFPALADSLNPYWNNNGLAGCFYQTTYNQTHNLSFSGKPNEKFDYKINAKLLSEKGIVKNTDFNRYGIRAAVGYKPNDRFHFGSKSCHYINEIVMVAKCFLTIGVARFGSFFLSCLHRLCIQLPILHCLFFCQIIKNVVYDAL